MNGELFIKHVLTLIVKEDISKLCGSEAPEVVIHMDSASSHTCRTVVKWMDDNNVKYIPKEQWLPNSPKVSPMDYFANSYLKNRLSRKRYTTIDGMLKVAKQEWQNIPLKMFQDSVSSWSGRVLAIHKARGHNVPQ